MSITAQEILESEAWDRLIDQVKEDLADEFARTDAIDAAQLQDVAYRLSAVDNIIDTLNAIAMSVPGNIRRAANF